MSRRRRRNDWIPGAVITIIVIMLSVVFMGLLAMTKMIPTIYMLIIGIVLAVIAAIIWLLVGLTLLILASRLLVYGAVFIAQSLGVSDLIIGLTVVAVGTSLPELASSLIAIKKGEHDIALGNVIGSNLFNTLAVVGIAAAIEPMAVEAVVLTRDWTLMAVLTAALFVMGYGYKKQGRINRLEGAILLAVFIGYTGYLISTVIS